MSIIQVIPAQRDVVVVVNGRAYSSAADGLIVLAPEDRHGIAEVAGLHVSPPLIEAEFTGWGDGDQQTIRSLDSIEGPVAQLGFNLRYRVIVVAGLIPPGEGAVLFDSAAGELSLPVGVPEWVIASRAVASSAGLTAQPILYSAVSLTRGDTTVALPRTTFIPQPEARWAVLP